MLVRVCQQWMADRRGVQRTDVAASHQILKEKLKKEDIEEIGARVHTDEDINELIARTPEEIELFNQMDEEEKKEIEKKKARGASPPPPRLMADREVPAWLQVRVLRVLLLS